MELVFVHLTDIHIKGEEDLSVLTPRADNIGRVICSHITVPDNSKVIFIFTGDFVFSGKEDEYIVAELFIEEILDVLRNRHTNVSYHLVFVPGNHDCDFDDPSNGLRKALLESNRLDIKDSIQLQHCTSVQNNYFAFASQMQALSCESDRIITVKEIQLDNIDLKLIFHCINTSWCSEINEKKGNMKFGIDILPERNQNDILFTLMHHDAEWLNWEDKEQWEKYHKTFSDFIFVGHDHSVEFTIKKNYDDSTRYYIRGNQLYDNSIPDQSGFNILKINTDTMQECFITYEWQSNIYKKIINTGYRAFEKNQYGIGGVQLKKNTRSYLEALDVDIKGKNNKELKLSDVFAFPTLKEKKEKGARFLRDLDSAIDFFMEKKWIVINGHKEYGKTTLLKWLFKSFYERKKFPVFLDPKKVPLSADGEKLNSFVEDSYINYYENIQREEIATKNPEELICLIDNLDLIQLDDKKACEFLKYLINRFAIVVVTRNMDLNIVNPINYVEMNSFLEDKFTALSIRPVSSSSKERLVNKWLMIDDENRGIDQVVFEGKRRDKYAQIQTVMQKNFFNKTPLDLLLVLSYLDQDDVVRIDYSKYSYIYEALIVMKLNQIADKDANTISVYKTILQQLAYHLYNEGKNEWVDEQYLMNIIFQYKESYSNLKLKAQEVVNRLVDYRFLENIGDEYCFKYSYMYYYFVANYISTKLSPEEKADVIKDVFNNLVDDMNYNVALFLLHSMNKEYDIIPIIRNQNKSLLSEFEKFRYDDLSKLIIQWGGDIEEEVRKIYTVPENKNIPELRKRKLDNRDEIDAIEEKSGKQHPSNDELRQINKEVLQIVRLVDLAGNLLKNYSGELNNNCREEIINIMICSVTKVIGAFCKFSMLAVYKIIDMVLERIRNGDGEDIEAQNSFTMFIKKLFADIWSHYVSLNIKYLARSLECDILRDNIDSYVSENPCEFSKMVRLEYIFRISQKLPVNDINMLFKGKNKLRSISRNILKNSIYGYLSSYQYDYKDKQRICSTLGFNIKDVLIEEQKNSEMNKL